jgi:hypothetical protein
VNLLDVFGKVVERGRWFEVAAVETGNGAWRTGIFPESQSVIRTDPATLRPVVNYNNIVLAGFVLIFFAKKLQCQCD